MASLNLNWLLGIFNCMNSLSERPSLKEINAYKRKINWGDVPANFHLVSSSLGDLDGILTHGFDSAYKRILNPSFWNLLLLKSSSDEQGNIKVKYKPKIVLRHEYNDMGYELHCYPVLHGEEEEIVYQNMRNNPLCPFNNWTPESMQMLFRVNSFVSFSIFCYQSGDEADIALTRYAHYRIEELIATLAQSFQIIEVKGYNIAQFYQEIAKKSGNILG